MKSEYLTKPNPELAALIEATVPGMAFWSGTGPAGKTCGQCSFLVEIAVGIGRSNRCAKYASLMMGKYGPKRIPSGTFACKYYDPKPEKILYSPSSPSS